MSSAEITSTAVVRRVAFVGILTLVAGLLTLDTAAEPAAVEWQTTDSIRSAARELVQKTLGTDTVVEAVAVDDRLKMPVCTVPLKSVVQNPIRNGKGTVAVSCTGTQPWRLFVPVQAVEQIDVLVTRRSVQAGAVLSAEDFSSVARASTNLPYDYLTAADQAVGLTVRHTIPAGTVLAPGSLESPALIERGALVTLFSGIGTVSVKSEGVALEPGRLNQRVRIKSRSGRVIEGVVEAAGQVRVGS